MKINKEDYELLVAQTEPGLELVGLMAYLERKGLSPWVASVTALELYEKYDSHATEESTGGSPCK